MTEQSGPKTARAAPAIRPMRGDDIDIVHQIECECSSTPWPLASLRFELTESPASRLFVAEGESGKIAGYIAVWIVADEMHINNLAVAAGWRRRGVASSLLEFALDDARRAGAISATLEVRRSNTAAAELYRRHGFSEAGMRRDYYQDPTEDGIILSRSLRTP